MAFDETASWSFGKRFVHNVFIIFGTDNSSSRELKISKNIFLTSVEEPTDSIHVSIFGKPGKNRIDFSQSINQFCLSLNYSFDKKKISM